MKKFRKEKGDKMKLKTYLVEILFIGLTTINILAIYHLNEKADGIDIEVIVSMSVGGMFVMLGMLRKKHKEEGRG
jgi:hypothetical protein